MDRLWKFVRGGECLAGCSPDKRPDLSVWRVGVPSRVDGGKSQFMLKIAAADDETMQAEEAMADMFDARSNAADARGDYGMGAVLGEWPRV